MKILAPNLFGLASSGAVALVLAGSGHAATVLTGSGQANNQDIQINFGSNLAGTPNIGLVWTPGVVTTGTSTHGVWQNYTTWTNGGGTGVAGEAFQLDKTGNYDGSLDFTIAFVPTSASYAALLTSVTLNDYTGGTIPSTTLNWTVTGSISGVLGSATGVVVTNSATPLNLNYLGVAGETLTLKITPTAGSGSYFALDNISFDQVAVPEPSSVLATAMGIGALALRRRRI